MIHYLNVSQLKRPHSTRAVITEDSSQKDVTFQRTDNTLVMNQGTDKKKSNFWVDVGAHAESSSYYYWKMPLQY